MLGRQRPRAGAFVMLLNDEYRSPRSSNQTIEYAGPEQPT